MTADLLPFIDWEGYPRRIIAAGEPIIAAGEPADQLYVLETGHAKVIDPAITYKDGSLLSLLELLSLDEYRHSVIAVGECRVITIRRDRLKALWDQDNDLAWPLSCSIAADITQTRCAKVSA
ncbi:cyclic nucleotide-binding domain-containing protein [Alphaproteobacteria bacterium]|nr:cyclic nucleotide-binding domain-containing protein [Alphaproteobacteria bacterium]